MSAESVEIVRNFFHAFRDRKWAEALELTDPGMVMDTSHAPIMEGLSGIYRGREEIIRFWGEWLEAWGEQRIAEPELISVEGSQVVAWIPSHELEGRGSGVTVDFPAYGWVTTVHDGKIVRATVFLDRREALEAAGLQK